MWGTRSPLSNNSALKKIRVQKRQQRDEHQGASHTTKLSKKLVPKKNKRDVTSAVNKQSTRSKSDFKVQHNKPQVELRREANLQVLDQGHLQKEVNEPPVTNAVSDSSSSSFRVFIRDNQT